MNTALKPQKKARTLWIALIQYLFLLYYLSYSNTLINNNYILIACAAILLCEIVLRGKISLRLLLAVLASGWAFLCSAVNGSGYGSAITQATLLISICLFSETELTRKQRRRVTGRMVFVLLAILTVFSNTTQYGSYYIPILTYFPSGVRVNPNAIAMLTFFLMIMFFALCEDADLKTGNKRILQMLALMFAIFYIYTTSARTSIVSALIFAFLFLFFKFKKHRATRILFYSGLCFTLVIAFVYIALYSSGFMVGETVLGKNFYTGREIIWLEAIDMAKDNLLFGFSNKVVFGPNGLFSVHNSLLAILCYFGVIGLISTLYVFFSSFRRIDHKNQKVITSALFATLLIMAFETLISDWSLILPFCLLFIQTKREGELTK